MIDEVNHRIYIDYSTRSRFQACKEKERLGGLLGYRIKQSQPSLDFGHAIHAGWEAYYDALAGGWHDSEHKWHTFEEEAKPDPFWDGKPELAYTDKTTPTERAQAAFLRDLGHSEAQLPVNIESEERRSLERGLYLLEAYIYRWRNEPYENILINGEPQTEVGFRYYITTYQDYEVWYVGYIDRLMRNIITKRGVVFEGKTTTQGLTTFVQQCKPNHQVTGYFPAAQTLLYESLDTETPHITECVWDCIFISDRLPNMKKGLTDRWWAYGIDIDKDFARQITTRSTNDISEFKIELEEDVQEYCKWLLSGKSRWPRTAPGACHAFGGCQFRNRCSMNLDQEQEEQFMNSLYRKERWEPWRKIVQRLT